MTEHLHRRSLRASLCLIGCTALLLTGCVRGDAGEDPSPVASTEPDAAQPTAKAKPETPSPSMASSPSPSPSPGPSIQMWEAPLPAPEDPLHPAYADIAPTTPSSTFTSPTDLAATATMREIPSTPGAVGTAVIYVAALRDGITSGDPSLMQGLSLPGCTGCAATADLIATQPRVSEEMHLTTVVWVLDVVEEPDGRTVVSEGVEATVTEADPADGTPMVVERVTYVWELELEDTPDGWAVRELTTEPWL